MATPKQLARAKEESFYGLDRTDAAPYSKTLALQKTNELRKATAVFERNAAEALHDQGSRLLDAFIRKIDRVLNHPSFEAYTLAEFGLSRQAAYDRIQFARFVSAAEATTFGYSRCVLAARLARHVKKDSLAALRKVRLKDEQGRVFTLGPRTPIATLQSVLRAFEVAALPGDANVAPVAVFEAATRLVDGEVARSPTLKALRVKVRRYRGAVEVKSRPPRGPAEMRALAELLLKVAALK